jgi:DNA-binding transcriptional ArsR family regulator
VLKQGVEGPAEPRTSCVLKAGSGNAWRIDSDCTIDQPFFRDAAPCSSRPPACVRLAHRIIYNRMVVRPDLSDAELDRVFRALADATRRDIVARLLAGEQTSISALAARYDMSFAAVQKHVTFLEGAGLVTKHPQGRERIVRGNPERIARARDLLARLEELWRARFNQLDTLFTEPSNPE